MQDKLDLLKRLWSQYGKLRSNSEEEENYKTEMQEYIAEKEPDVTRDVDEWSEVSAEF